MMDYEEMSKLLDQKLDEKLKKQTLELEGKFNTTVEFLYKEIESLKTENRKIQSAYNSLKKENESIKLDVMMIKTDLKNTKQANVKQEQYSRKNNIKIYGMAITE